MKIIKLISLNRKYKPCKKKMYYVKVGSFIYYIRRFTCTEGEQIFSHEKESFQSFEDRSSSPNQTGS